MKLDEWGALLTALVPDDDDRGCLLALVLFLVAAGICGLLIGVAVAIVMVAHGANP